MPTESHAARRMASRIREIMEHTYRYAFDGRVRLIADTGLSRSEVTRLLSGDCNPSYRAVLAVTGALERDLGIRLDSRDVLSFSGEFPTPTVCQLVSCRGCPRCHPFVGPGSVPELPGEKRTLPIPAVRPHAEHSHTI